MTISIWRYAHLLLALISSVFLTLASVTGIILAADAVNEKYPSYKADSFNEISLAQTIPMLRKTYSDISEIDVDERQFVTLQGSGENGNDVNAYIDPRTGKVLGKPRKQSEFILWVTSFHRSLFLHTVGRIFIGAASFLLILIAVSGIALIMQRQRGLSAFFSKIIREYFSQYYHIVLGRLFLIPILLIAITGTYLSMKSIGLLPEKEIKHDVKTDENESTAGKKNPADFAVFKNIKLADVKKIEFPFADDPNEYYTLQLKDRELIIDQFNGKILSDVKYPFATLVANTSMNVHTGRTSILWAIILAVACINILFFIYSGFVITLRRRSVKIKNKFKADNSKFILLAGSENGSTLRFANAVLQQLIADGQKAHLTQLNNYTVYPNAEHIIVFTATHGLGEAPANANKFSSLIKKYPQTHAVNVSVVGFGSRSYPDFCAFAKETEQLFAEQNWSVQFMPLHTINNKSAEEFSAWIKIWSDKMQMPLVPSPALYAAKPPKLQAFTVTGKTEVANEDNIFTVRLRARNRLRFKSGDLLIIYPNNDHQERFYSIGKIKGDIQLVVKRHENGLGSGYLHDLEIGKIVKARVIRNPSFSFPKKAFPVAMIANGTGIAPFIGMIEENDKKVETRLYCGFRAKTSLPEIHHELIEKNIKKQKLEAWHIAYSKEGEKQYVTDLIAKDENYFAELFIQGGTIMICGSIAMQNDVLKILERIAKEKTDKDLSYYKSRGQLLSDCY